MRFTELAYEAGRSRWEALKLTLRMSQDERKLPEWDDVPPSLIDVT